MDIIEQVDGPSSWVSAMVPIIKNDKEIRICLDMRQVNKAVLREKYPLPTMDELLPNLVNCKIFSRLDVRNAFHQIELHPNSRHITTFITNNRMYRYKRLLFGISSAPEIFQKIMEQILSKCDGLCFNYIDDIIVYGASINEHDVRLNAVLNTLNEQNVFLN